MLCTIFSAFLQLILVNIVNVSHSILSHFLTFSNDDKRNPDALTQFPYKLSLSTCETKKSCAPKKKRNFYFENLNYQKRTIVISRKKRIKYCISTLCKQEVTLHPETQNCIVGIHFTSDFFNTFPAACPIYGLRKK